MLAFHCSEEQKYGKEGLHKERSLGYLFMQPIKNIPPKLLAPGITGHYAHGEKTTFGLVELEKGSNVPLHQHIHEQITYILDGQLDMMIGGVAYSLTAGMYHVIPSGTPHSAVAISDCKVIDVFGPVRDDYKTNDTPGNNLFLSVITT